MEADTGKFALKIDVCRDVTNKVFWLGIVTVICITAYKIILALAGKNTAANIGIKILGDLKFTASVAWGIGSTGLYFREKRAKERIIKGKSEQIINLQNQLDIKRQSSGLTETGCTNRSDL